MDAVLLSSPSHLRQPTFGVGEEQPLGEFDEDQVGDDHADKGEEEAQWQTGEAEQVR